MKRLDPIVLSVLYFITNLPMSLEGHRQVVEISTNCLIIVSIVCHSLYSVRLCTFFLLYGLLCRKIPF